MNTKWQTWRKLKIGGSEFKAASDFLSTFDTMGISTDECSRALLETVMPSSAKELNIILAIIRVSDLGLPPSSDMGMQGISVRDFFGALQRSGLGLVPSVTGFYLRLDYLDQPDDKKIHMAMETVKLNAEGRNLPAGLMLFGKHISGDCIDQGMSLMSDGLWVCRIVQ